MAIDIRYTVCGILLGGALAFAAPASADPVDVHARVKVAPHTHVGVTTRFERVDRFRRVPPEIRLRGGWRGGVHVRVNAFRPFVGGRIARFSAPLRARWVRGHWWHGRWHGRLGWWWYVDGGWFFYPAPVYPYPDYVSETYYEEPAQDYGDYWYYCRDPEGYYPYVQHCSRAWEPVPAQPERAYGGGYGEQDQYDNEGPGGDEMGPDENGPPDEYGPSDNGPPDEEGPPDSGPDDNGPPPDDNGPPDNGPPPR